MKRLIDYWGDLIWVNKEQICFVEKSQEKSYYTIHFTNGDERNFTKEEIKKLNEE